jgi:glutathione-specific gamma-glutamylcyclotransferase
VVFRVPQDQGEAVLRRLWPREMPLATYDPKWIWCQTNHGPVKALAFTLSRKSPSHTGLLTEAEYRRIFAEAQGRYGTTLEYAHRTHEELRRHNIRDRALERLLQLARAGRDHDKPQ